MKASKEENPYFKHDEWEQLPLEKVWNLVTFTCFTEFQRHTCNFNSIPADIYWNHHK